MSGRELDPDGTDSYHPEHPWEQVGHEKYIAPSDRNRENWPPEDTHAIGPYEAAEWIQLPAGPIERAVAVDFDTEYTIRQAHKVQGVAETDLDLIRDSAAICQKHGLQGTARRLFALADRLEQ